MRVYVLKSKDGETINNTKADSIENATLIFAKVKNLSFAEIVKLFVVERKN